MAEDPTDPFKEILNIKDGIIRIDINGIEEWIDFFKEFETNIEIDKDKIEKVYYNSIIEDKKVGYMNIKIFYLDGNTEEYKLTIYPNKESEEEINVEKFDLYNFSPISLLSEFSYEQQITFRRYYHNGKRWTEISGTFYFEPKAD